MDDGTASRGVHTAAVLNAVFNATISGKDTSDDEIAVAKQIQTAAFAAPAFFNQFVVEDAAAFNSRSATDGETTAVASQVAANQAVADGNQPHGLHAAAHAIDTAADSLSILDDQTVQNHGSRQRHFATADDAADVSLRLRQHRRIGEIPCVAAILPFPPFRQRRLVSFETAVQRHAILQFK